MVSVVSYPNCCGGKVIQGFTGPEEEVLNSFLNALHAWGNNRYLLKFVLNQDQIRRYPRVLEAAANAGFVISATWVNGGHNSNLVEFQRARFRRRSIREEAERMGWQGQLIQPTMIGELPAITNPPPRNAVRAANQWRTDGRGNRIVLGDRVIVTSQRSQFRRRFGQVVHFSMNWEGTGVNRVFVHIRIEDSGSVIRLVAGSVAKVNENGVLIEPTAQEEPQRPQYLYDERPVIETEDAPQQAERTVVFSTYHNFFRDGRTGGGFDTLEEAIAAAPLCYNQRRRDIYSDGTVEWTELPR